jgi:hypothetical protein
MTEWFPCNICGGPVDEEQYEENNGIHQGCDPNNAEDFAETEEA